MWNGICLPIHVVYKELIGNRKITEGKKHTLFR